MEEFMGYRRPDGRVGIRNHVIILPCSICASDTARMLAAKVPGTVFVNTHTGCSQVPSDLQYTLDGLAGIAANPNVYGTILVSIGCESAQARRVAADIRARTNKPLEFFVIREEGGTVRLIERAAKSAQRMLEESKKVQKEKCPITELIMGTECGGSDPTSGIASNPVIGVLSDILVEKGATSILSETTEFTGAEHILAGRAKNEEVRQRILDIVERYEQHFKNNGENVRKGNPAPGNIAGGITTLEEKSLGCIHKGGSSVINAVYDYAKQISPEDKGLVIMDTPGTDAPSIAGMIAGGAQIIVYSTGHGSPLGSPITPVIKVTGNSETFRVMNDNTDFDASLSLSGEKTIEELGRDLYEELMEVVNGKQTKSEILGFTETTFMRACNFV